MRLLLCITFALSILNIQPAHAVKELQYGTDISFTARFNINTYLAQEFETTADTYRIAPIDLNGDGVDEFILQRKRCYLQKKLCTHLILAEKDSQTLLLSKIRARTLMAGGTSTNGITDILAFKSEVNDYGFEIYMWSSEQKKYILKAEEVENSE